MFAEHLLVSRCRLGTAGRGADNVKCPALLDSDAEKLQKEESTMRQREELKQKAPSETCCRESGGKEVRRR